VNTGRKPQLLREGGSSKETALARGTLILPESGGFESSSNAPVKETRIGKSKSVPGEEGGSILQNLIKNLREKLSTWGKGSRKAREAPH